jgi:hypothetical protein
MDQETLKLLTRVKVSARKAIGLDIDVSRLTRDRHYANQVLGDAARSDNEDLVLVALTLQDKFGFFEEPKAEPVAAAAGDKYILGARG